MEILKHWKTKISTPLGKSLKKHRSAAPLSVVLLSLVLGVLTLLRVHERYFSPGATVVFWDVGQGDSQLIQLPYGKNYLLDTGGGRANRRIGEELFLELGRKGILRLQALIISHPDEDHASGSLDLYKNIKVDELWLHSGLNHVQESGKLLRQLKADTLSRSIPIREISSPLISKGPGYRLNIFPIHPQVASNSNNLALIAELEVYGCHFLFLGDLEKEEEWYLAKLIKRNITVVKVAHHGSLTSSSPNFVRNLSPRFAVISVGEGNPYGHPRKEVIERFRFQGAEVLRTDFHGFIEFKVSPQGDLKCRNALGSCGAFHCR